MNMLSRFMTPILVVLAAAASVSCRDAPLAVNVRSNMPPVAHAGDMQVLEYDGSPIPVTLDGSESSDPDGQIVSYRWFSGNARDGGMGRAEPDPEDVARPSACARTVQASLRQPGYRSTTVERPLALRPGLATGLPLSRIRGSRQSKRRIYFAGDEVNLALNRQTCFRRSTGSKTHLQEACFRAVLSVLET